MEVNFREILEMNVRAIAFFGFLTPVFDSKVNYFFYMIYASLFIGCIYYGQILSESVAMYLVLGDIEKMTSASFLYLTHVIQIYKYYCCKRYHKRIHKLLDSLNRSEFMPKNENQKKILEDSIRTSKIVTKTFLWMCVLTCSLWGIFPFLDEEIHLPLAGWFPFPTDSSPLFEIAYGYQIFAAVINGLSNISLDTFISGHIMAVSAQLKILNDTLDNFDEIMKEKFENYDDYNKKGMLECINHHRSIIAYAEEYADIFSNCLMGQFLVGVLIICMTMFQMSLVSVMSIQFFSMVGYQSCILLEQYLHCYYGNEVILSSYELTKSAYRIQWIDKSSDFKKDLLYFMIRSQKPLKLYAGGFFTLSLETFVVILKTSWSYFAVLNRVHSK